MSGPVKVYALQVETGKLVAVDDPFRKAVGRRIRQARERAGLSQNALAHLLPGAPAASQISRWERGEALPKPANLQALAEVLNVTVAYFFGG